ncbi:MAG: T9SS type A sorting domain-containing protein [Bacteroidales bacterium]|nr:T9SS type A sorting domain-containing protein [Bacteroidales bacterium]HNS47739.1 T9SS type A sorting domain-containing protein [Bacteroidales bacterium]
MRADRISVTNAAGQVLFEQRIKEGSVIESVDISDFPAGVYFVKTISKDHVSVFRFHKI